MTGNGDLTPKAIEGCPAFDDIERWGSAPAAPSPEVIRGAVTPADLLPPEAQVKESEPMILDRRNG